MTHAESEPEQVDPRQPPIDPVPPASVAPSAAPASAEPAAPVSTIHRGPGVIPPFVAPPREGVNRRRWIGIGIAAGLAVLCCGGGGAGLFGLVVTINNHRFSDARTVVTSYMNDKTAEHYAAAYQLLCANLKDRYTLTEFIAEVSGEPIVNFVVESAVDHGSYLAVPVSVDYASGEQGSTDYEVVVDADGSSRVCGSAQ